MAAAIVSSSAVSGGGALAVVRAGGGGEAGDAGLGDQAGLEHGGRAGVGRVPAEAGAGVVGEPAGEVVGHVRAGPPADRHELLDLQEREGLADGGAPHAELLRELALAGQALARPQAPGGHLGDQVVGDLLVALADRWGLRGGHQVR
jgi:hypothetical protein